jgi:hypothetical protein
MRGISRRDFLKTTAAGTAAAGFFGGGAARLSANPLGLPIGSQTYPHRQMIADGKFVELLKELKSIGVDQVELCGFLGGTGYPEFKVLADGKTTRKMIAPRQPGEGYCLVQGSWPGADNGSDDQERHAGSADHGNP